MERTEPTMKDVAREAGVALGTVSKVFNGIPVGESYRIKVEEAAQKLGYQINHYARGLKTNKTNIVGVILPEMGHPYYADLAEKLYVALEQRGYRMMLFLTAASTEREQECVRLVRQNKLDGIIGLTYSSLELGNDVPFISIDRHFGNSIPCVASDNYNGGRLAAERLAELGCRKLLFLRTGSSVPGEADKRGDGFLAACRQLPVSCDSLRINDGNEQEIFRRFFLDHMEDGRLEFDGIFCSTDYLAGNIRRILEELGLRVPQDVQIVGFDGLRSFVGKKYLCSTIVQSTEKIAETCVELLLRTDRDNIPSLVCLPVTYAVGGTTKEQEEPDGQ